MVAPNTGLNVVQSKHPLGRNTAVFAANIDRWNMRMLSPTEENGRVTDTGITSDGINNLEMTVTAPTLKRKVKWLDEGEGKICVHANMSDDDGSEVNDGDGDEPEDIQSGSAAEQFDKVREGNTPCLRLQRTRDSGSSISDTNHIEEEKCAHSDTPTSDTAGGILAGGSDGLRPPQLMNSNAAVLGTDKGTLRKQNKARRLQATEIQPPTSAWSSFKGEFYIPDDIGLHQPPGKQMCPSGLALKHPA